MTAAKSVTANYDTQYQLSLATNPSAVGTSHITGASDGDWFNSGDSVTLTADQLVANGTGSRYSFKDWTGSASTTNSATITMTAAKSRSEERRVGKEWRLAR